MSPSPMSILTMFMNNEVITYSSVFHDLDICYVTKFNVHIDNVYEQ